MDKTGIIVISICVLLLGWWFVEQNKIARQQALFEQTNELALAWSRLAATNSPTPTGATPSALSTVTVPVAFNTNLPEQTIVLTGAQARYTFTSRGGGLKLVELLAYPQTISARWQTKDGSRTNGVASLNTLALVPSFAVLGDPAYVGDGNFTLSRTASGVQAEKVLANGLREIKEFRLGSNYLVNATVRLFNTTDKPLTLPAEELVVGTATPMDPDDNGQAEGVMWSDGAKASSQPLAVFLGGGCSRSGPRTEVVGGSGNVAWVAAYNQFFALMAIPQLKAQQMIARPVTLPQFASVHETNGILPRGIQTALVYPAQTISANSSVDQQVALFAGPKEYRTLADIGAQFQNRADDVMGFGSVYGFCAKPLLLAMNWLHDVTTLGYGLVIVLLTFLLRAIFWPLTAASTRSMKRMQALAPEMAALKEKYKDDQQKFAQKQMELWKKHGVNPMSGCWPMLIQMPVFFGFFTMIRSAIELRGAHFLWAADLSKPDTLFMIPGITFIPGLSTPEGLPFNLLPLLMGAAMLWQSHLTPASPGMDASQQKIMRYMPLIFLVFLYNYSAGMSLYMVVSTLLSVLQTKLTRNLKDPAAPAAPAGPRVNPALTPASKSKK
ncbi:MAG: membrane protein insertase YidC [Verrucomicrobiota bacterium]